MNKWQFARGRSLIENPKRIGVTNIKSVCVREALIAFVDMRDDLYIVGPDHTNKAKLMSSVVQVEISQDKAIYALTL